MKVHTAQHGAATSTPTARGAIGEKVKIIIGWLAMRTALRDCTHAGPLMHIALERLLKGRSRPGCMSCQRARFQCTAQPAQPTVAPHAIYPFVRKRSDRFSRKHGSREQRPTLKQGLHRHFESESAIVPEGAKTEYSLTKQCRCKRVFTISLVAHMATSSHLH